MQRNDILKMLQEEIHTVILATTDEAFHPVTAAIDIMLYQSDKLYFLTAKGKSLYQRLQKDQYVAMTGLKGSTTLTSIAISVRGNIKAMGQTYLEEIFNVNPYMKEIYPNEEARKALEVFELYEYEGEFFDLSQQPILRIPFSFHHKMEMTQYVIKEDCNGCGRCLEVCPQRCILHKDSKMTILQEHCLHCGRCIQVCANHSIEKQRKEVAG